jgi:two-component system OmpR family response regulator
VRIVLVEDEPDLRGLVCDLLRDEGYDVLPFVRPAPVIRLRARGVAPDLFLIDIMLPEMDGITLASRLHEDGFNDIPMIAMSASPLMLQMATNSHLFVSTVTKPFDIGALLGCIGSYVVASR